ncbi:arylamine N-acetyltransferase family protein [Actinocorallia lasiicapitis]
MEDEQIAAYLDRISVERPAVPDAVGLAALQAAHLRAVPFENLSIALGQKIVLTPEALYDKIVTGRRGGFCYELNGLFAELLRGLGYRVTLQCCRVFHDDGLLGAPFDHLALRVDLDEPYLVDVGFGAFSDRPLRLGVRGVQEDPAGDYEIRENGEFLDVHENGAGAYQLDPRSYALSDFVPHCWYHQTSPDSHFTRSDTCSIRTATGRATLSRRRLIVTADGVRTEHPLADDAAVLAAYREHFGIVLDAPPES